MRPACTMSSVLSCAVLAASGCDPADVVLLRIEGSSAGMSNAGAGGHGGASGGRAGDRASGGNQIAGTAGAEGTTETCPATSQCPASSMCRKDECAEAMGRCEPIPASCPRELNPVCGSDRLTY